MGIVDSQAARFCGVSVIQCTCPATIGVEKKWWQTCVQPVHNFTDPTNSVTVEQIQVWFAALQIKMLPKNPKNDVICDLLLQIILIVSSIAAGLGMWEGEHTASR